MSRRICGIAAACATLLFTGAGAADLPLPKDGWASWQVEAVEDAPAFCCWSSWDSKGADPSVCDLDVEHHGYGTRGPQKTDALRVYARFSNGKPEKLRTLAAGCAVKSTTPVHDLGPRAVDESARWLVGLARGDVLNEDALTSLAIHRGALAFDSLKNIARDDPRIESRKQALFWLALARGVPGAEIVAHALSSDRNAEVREHATFAITQSKSPGIAADLIKAGNTDADGDVRAQAWFWLARTGTPGAESAIVQALEKDRDSHVREQAVFALSQLPDDRAAQALIRAAEDRSLSREQRKRALFWLAQSETAGAQAYLDKVLLGASR
jgi:hypothetical protein